MPIQNGATCVTPTRFYHWDTVKLTVCVCVFVCVCVCCVCVFVPAVTANSKLKLLSGYGCFDSLFRIFHSIVRTNLALASENIC